ncbi:MAG: hypothetical protein AAF225_02040 [Pseudomonadota bacterium]
MLKSSRFPDEGLLAYLGPALTVSALAALEGRGYKIIELVAPGQPDSDLPDSINGLILGIGCSHPLRGAFQTEAERRGLPCATDLAFLAEIQLTMAAKPRRRIVITGSAGKSFTSVLAQHLLLQGGVQAEWVSDDEGYLNLLGSKCEAALLEVPTASCREAIGLHPGVVAVLNLSDEHGGPIAPSLRDAAADLLVSAPVGVLGADDLGTQSLMMTARRRMRPGDQRLVPISGGATLSDGCFALDQSIYANTKGRTRRIAQFNGSPVLLGTHLAQDAAAAVALAMEFHVNDTSIGHGLATFRGLSGRFDCIGTDGRVVFVDDRSSTSLASTEAAIAACPDVFWIGQTLGPLPKKIKSLIRSAFYVTPPDGSGPPADGIVTFKDADEATAAALRSATDVMRAEPLATPVILFSPGGRGLERQGELFRIKALSFLSEGQRAHG